MERIEEEEQRRTAMRVTMNAPRALCVFWIWNPLLTKRLCHCALTLRKMHAATHLQVKFAASSMLPLPLYRAT
jgi:hypothetical protein